MLDLLAASDWVSAAIGAGGAVLGALAGGSMTYAIERSRDRTRLDLERMADERATQGIARVWSKKLGDFYVLVDDHSPPQDGSYWWRDENDVDSAVDVADMKRVAAVATPQQWRDIDYALTHVREARAARDFALSSAEDAAINATDIDTVRGAMVRIEAAIERLAELSGDKYPPEWLRDRIFRSEQPGGWRPGGDAGPEATSSG